ncbi:rifampicin phosphotransferase-like isoform X2 [Lycorma delicatula]|uniref:rifampicin phosphotransferase-like isoform X2 n=1 Tax=Lycorma delicatula TaxID=130591 RepID=UPI003F51A82A
MFYIIFLFFIFLLLFWIFNKRRLNIFGFKTLLHYVNNLLYPSSLKPFSRDLFLPSAKDEHLEEGKHIPPNQFDSMVFTGTDLHGNRLVTKITQLQKSISEANIFLHLANGSTYSKTCETSKTTESWSAGCLLFEIIEPMKNWRISFNGSLRSVGNSEHHVRFNLIWKSFCQPYMYEHKTFKTTQDNSRLKINEEEDGYEQWGSIIGRIIIGSEEYNNMHLMSLRQRYWGPRKLLTIIGFSMSGTMFSLSQNKSESIGRVRFPKGDTRNITSNCELISFPESLKFKISGKNNFDFSVKYDHETNLHSKNLCLISFDGFLNLETVEGLVQVWDSHACANDAQKTVEENVNYDTQVLLLKLDSPHCKNTFLVGGKAASLAVLSTLVNPSCKPKAVVPQGFCLTKMAMDLQIQSSRELKAAVRTFMQEAHLLDLTQTCNRIQEVWLKTKVCTELQYVISEHIEINVPYAIRSSGLTEDTAKLSSAGQNATFLACIGLESILRAIQKCWASLYSFQSVQYRRLHGIPLKSSMGIVIQKMVASEIGGVMFTCDPVTGNPFETVITANYGLGETVVSAAVEPDSIRLQKQSAEGKVDFIIKSQTCGKKTHQYSMTGNGLIMKLNLNDTTANEICISQEEAKLLANIGGYLEEEFGSPCDIEWAILKETVYLLQCRPVTTLHAWTDEELLHEFDSALLPMDVTSTANTGEVLPGATSLLSQSLLVHTIDMAITTQANRNAIEDNFYNYFNTIISHQHVFIHIFNTLLIKIERERTPAQSASELAVCGHIVIDDSTHQLAVLRNGVISPLIKLQTMLNAFYVTKKHSFISTVNVFWQVILLLTLLEGQNDLTSEHFEDISKLLQSCSSVISAEIPSDVEEIANKISDSKNKEEFCNMPPNLAKHWLKVHCPEASHLLAKFLIFHGHRSVCELDFFTETWGLNSTPLLENIQNIVKGCNRKQEKIISDNVDVINQLKTPKKSFTWKALQFMFPFCQKSTEQREVTKNSLLLVIHTFRIAFNQLGNLMIRENYLPHPKLIFFCSYYEIKKLLLTRDSMILHKALRRQRLWDQWDILRFPEIMKSLPTPISLETIAISNDKLSVKGTLVFPGRAEGRACVMLDSKELSQVQAGDILITISTDVGWTPLFPLLSGIVTELGGLISHGAVVAREYGVPCLVGATSATSVFKTGDKVILDGANGIIYKITEEMIEK